MLGGQLQLMMRFPLLVQGIHPGTDLLPAVRRGLVQADGSTGLAHSKVGTYICDTGVEWI